jgi:hypothetical protein
MAKKKLIPKRSGHGDVHLKKLTSGQLAKLERDGRVFITIRGVRKKVTWCNVKKGAVEWYRRSDTKSIALRNYCSDLSRSAAEGVRNRKGRGYEADTRYVKSKDGWI